MHELAEPRVRVPMSKRWTGWRGLYLALAFLVCLPLPARAEGISGRVYDPEGKPLTNQDCTAELEKDGKKPVSFKTDAEGSFSVYLDSGQYKVLCKKGETSMQGKLESYSEPAQQDIHMKKKEG